MGWNHQDVPKIRKRNRDAGALAHVLAGAASGWDGAEEQRETPFPGDRIIRMYRRYTEKTNLGTGALP